MIKKIFKYALLLILLPVLILLSVLFIRPELVLNPQLLSWGLRHSGVLSSFSWKSARMDHHWIKWNRRGFSGELKNFCLLYDQKAYVSTCLEEVSWNLEFHMSWRSGFEFVTKSPLQLYSKKTFIRLKESPPKTAKSAPMDIWGYWQKLWSGLTPDLEIAFESIELTKQEKKFTFDVRLEKKAKSLTIRALDFFLEASPESWILRTPKKYALPKKIKHLPQLYFYEVSLKGDMSKRGVDLLLAGALEVAQFKVRSFVAFPLPESFASEFRKNVLLKTTASVTIPGIKGQLSRFAPDPFKELPAPLNVMDGEIEANGHFRASEEPSKVEFTSESHVRLKSQKQVLDFDLAISSPLDLKSFKPGTLDIGLSFNDVLIQLPRISKKTPPPQFFPDRRFQSGPMADPAKKDSKKPKLDLDLEALDKNAMSFRTDLLDEILKLNFDLDVRHGKIQDGFLRILPLKTKVFKRPVHLQNMKVTFNHPVEPTVVALIEFPLPEYKVTLNLEGPVSKPRYHFTSKPPLPENDIYSVLLFGRPMSELSTEDKTAAQKTNQLLSQGILSLSVLYFLSGSPVEYVGYDPDSKNATAQFGLGQKTSLRVGGGQDGLNSSGVRRSLGKGWYLDTSVQSTRNPSSSEGKNYGVLLERVISY